MSPAFSLYKSQTSARPEGALATARDARNLKSQTSNTVPRSDYRLVQTPQCFDIQLLKAANRAADGSPVSFTDDASVVEAFGFDITLVEGNRENIKITTPFDLTIGEALCSTASCVSPAGTFPQKE